jgi:hypothetical protein
MSIMMRIVAIGAIVIVTLAAGAAAWVLSGTGFWRTIEHRFEGACHAVYGVPAAEDIVIDATTGLAYLSSFRADTAGIYAYDLEQRGAVPVRIDRGAPAGMLPLGIALWPRSGEATHLLAFNRAPAGVEVFRFAGALSLQHVRSIRDPLIRFPNNLVATGPERFYVTNTHASEPGSLARTIETLFRLTSGGVVFFDGDAARPAAEDIGYANGIAATAAGDRIYVGSITTSEVLAYTRDADDRLALVARPAAISHRLS